MERNRVSPADLFRLETETTNLQPGEAVFREGEKGEVVYILLDGRVDVFVGDRLVETAERGAILAEMALIDNSPRAASAIAKTSCRLVPVTRRRFVFMVQQTPNFSLHVMKVWPTACANMDRLLAKNAAAASGN